MKLVWKWMLFLLSILMAVGCLETDPIGEEDPGLGTTSASTERTTSSTSWIPIPTSSTSSWIRNPTSGTFRNDENIPDCIAVDENGIIVIYFDAIQIDVGLFKDPDIIKYFQEYIESEGTKCFNQPELWLPSQNITDLTGLEQLEKINLLELHLDILKRFHFVINYGHCPCPKEHK